MLHNFRARHEEANVRLLAAVALSFVDDQDSDKPIAISHDSRTACRGVAAHISRLLSGEIYHLGQVTTPIASWFGAAHKTVGIHVTASHGPIDFVGLKLMVAGVAIAYADEVRLREAARAALAGTLSRHRRPQIANIQDDAWTLYAAQVAKRAKGVSPCVEVRTTWLRQFRRFFPWLEFLGRTTTDPARELSAPPTARRSATVARLDEDADQVIWWVGGRRVSGAAVLYQWLSATSPTGRVVLSYDTPRRVVALIEAQHSITSFTEVGDQYVLDAMIRSGAPVGGEPNGHLISLNNCPCPDGLVAALQIGESPPELPQLEPLLRQAAYIDRDALREDLMGLGFVQNYGMWERIGPTFRMLVRLSMYEDSVVVQVEGKANDAADTMPPILANAVYDVLDVHP